MRHVLVNVRLNNGWDEWQYVGGFSFNAPKWHTAEQVARHARFIVDRKAEETVRVEVFNPDTKLYDQEFVLRPMTF
jgi:hypothetical protein